MYLRRLEKRLNTDTEADANDEWSNDVTVQQKRTMHQSSVTDELL